MNANYEECVLCDARTGRSGRNEDSIYIVEGNVDWGPLCEECIDSIERWVFRDWGVEVAMRRAEVAEAEHDRLKAIVEKIRDEIDRRHGIDDLDPNVSMCDKIREIIQ